MPEEFPTAHAMFRGERRILAYASPGERRVRSLAHSWFGLGAGLAAGTCVVGYCSEHTLEFFA
jgi:hypothetical protein